MFIKKLHTPEGVRDYTPEEMETRAHIENGVADLFRSFGYREVKTPTFEYAEVFENKGSVSDKNIYKFVDRDGSVISLRPDMTPAIARLAATCYTDADMPLRLCYFENMFRSNAGNQGKQREFRQAGAELIGASGICYDAEILVLACESLLKAGIEDFEICVGHSRLIPALLNGVENCEEITAALADKNYVLASELIKDADVSENVKTVIYRLPQLIGDLSETEEAEKLLEGTNAKEYITYLKDIYTLLGDHGKYISFDLSVIGSMDYYTGIVFRGYVRGIGFSVIDGGRYDNLLSQFGMDKPAVGFALKVSDLMKLHINGSNTDTHISISGNDPVKVINIGQKLRESCNKTITYAFEHGNKCLNHVHIGEKAEIDLEGKHFTCEADADEIAKTIRRES